MSTRAALALLMMTAIPALARQPSGEGDPKEERCMRIELPTGKMGSGALCKSNADWAQLTKDGVKLDQFGEPIPPPDARNVAEHGCSPAFAGGPRSDGTRALSFKCH